MKPDDKRLANLKPFKKGENTVSPNAHRPRNRIKAIAKADAISSQDRKNLTNMLLNSTPEEVKQFATDPTQPFFVVSVALSLLEDAKKRRYTTWEMLLDWNLGKAVQPSVGITSDLSTLTNEEYEAKKAEFFKNNAEMIRKMAEKLP